MSDYQKMKVADLKKICKERKIAGYSKMKKAELVALLNKKDAEKQKSQSPKQKTQEPVAQEPPMPACLVKDTTGFEDMVKEEKQDYIEIPRDVVTEIGDYMGYNPICDTLKIKTEQKDEVLSDLDEMLENYDEKEAEEERLRQEEEERLRKEEEERKRKEAEEKERLRKEEEERKRKEAEEKRMKEEMLKKLAEMKRQEEEKKRKQQIQSELSKYETEDIVAFLKSKGYNVAKQAKFITKKQTAILRNTVEDLDLLSE